MYRRVRTEDPHKSVGLRDGASKCVNRGVREIIFVYRGRTARRPFRETCIRDAHDVSGIARAAVQPSAILPRKRDQVSRAGVSACSPFLPFRRSRVCRSRCKTALKRNVTDRKTARHRPRGYRAAYYGRTHAHHPRATPMYTSRVPRGGGCDDDSFIVSIGIDLFRNKYLNTM